MSFTKCSSSNVVRTCFCAVALAITASASQVFAQGVGINTTTPDPSAALDVVSSNKGVLIPRVSLVSLSDVQTVPAPAHGLMVYHQLGTLGGKGFFYNGGTAAAPIWRRVSDLVYPYSHVDAEDLLFNLENLKPNSTTIRTYNASGYALDVAGRLKIAGPTQSAGSGKVLTSDASGNATWQGASAFRVSGILKGGAEIMGSAPAKILFATESYDLNNHFNDLGGNPTNTFAAPVKGIYHFDALLRWDQVDDHNAMDFGLLTIIKNSGNVESTAIKNQVLLDAYTISASTDVQLNAGDLVYAIFSHSALSSFVYLSDGWFTGRLVIAQP